MSAFKAKVGNEKGKIRRKLKKIERKLKSKNKIKTH